MIPDDPNNPMLHAMWLEKYNMVKAAEAANNLAADQALEAAARMYGVASPAPTAPVAPGGALPTGTPHEDMGTSPAGGVTVQNWN